MSAPDERTSSISPSGWVEPQSALMFRPSGSTAVRTRSAPRAWKITGAARWVAPFAQSSATRMPERSSWKAVRSSRM